MKLKESFGLGLEIALFVVDSMRTRLVERLDKAKNLHWAAYVGTDAMMRASQERERIAKENYANIATRYQLADESARRWQKAFDELKKRATADGTLPALTVDCVVLAEEHVLLVRRGHEPHKGKWALPGGYMNAGETLRAAAARELLEETGLGCEALLKPIGFSDAPGRDPRGRVISYAFGAVLPAKAELTAGDDAEEAEWVHLHVLQKDQLAFDHGEILSSALLVI
jgi:ADP-ribose pyrophosphatase YjhB (NUDIX family)